MPTSDSVIRTYYVITGLYSLAASLIWGVNTLFLLDAGLSVFEVFVANAIFTAAMVVFEVPTGVVADTRGRRLSFLLALAVMVVGTLGYVSAAWWGQGVVAFSLWSVVLGLGYTFFSGAVEAWLVDALNATGHDGTTDPIFARGGTIYSAGMLIGTTGGGALGQLDLSLPYVVRSAVLVLLFGIALFAMRDLGFHPRQASLAETPGEMRRVFGESLRFGWSVPTVRWLMLAAATCSFSFAWGYYSWQPYFLELLEKDAVWVAGVIAAAVSLSTMAGNMLVEYLTRFCGKRTTLLYWGYGVQAVAFGAVGLVGDFWLACALYLVASAAVGVVGPVERSYLHAKIPSEQRATVVSFQSLVTSGASMTGQTGLGWLAGRVGFGPGYVIGGAVLAVALPLIARIRGAGEEADRIVGTASEGPDACPRGLPDP